MIRNGGRLLVDCLIALGATKSFGVPGESYLAVLDALHDTGGKLDYVLCRNEGGAAFKEVDYRAVFGTLAKWAVEIDDVVRLPEIVARAWTAALTGRPGPVVVA